MQRSMTFSDAMMPCNRWYKDYPTNVGSTVLWMLLAILTPTHLTFAVAAASG